VAITVGETYLFFRPRQRQATEEQLVLRLIADANRASAARDQPGAERFARRAFDLASGAEHRVKPGIRAAAAIKLAGSLIDGSNNADAAKILEGIGKYASASDLTPANRMTMLYYRCCLYFADHRNADIVRELEPVVYPAAGRLEGASPLGTRPESQLESLVVWLLPYLGFAYHALGRYGDAAKTIRRYRAQEGRTTEVWKEWMVLSLLGKSELMAGNVEAARAALSELENLASRQNADLVFTAAAAELAFKLGEKATGKKWAEMAIAGARDQAREAPKKVAPSVDAVMAPLGHACLSAGEPALAEAVFRQELEVLELPGADRSISRAYAMNNIAVAQRDQGHYESALQLLNEALAVGQAVANADQGLIASIYKNIGIAQHKLGNTQAAAEAFSRAVSIAKTALPEGDVARQKVLQACRELGYE
jgi:tetratricopeptide (TPR) repeat protein